MRAQRKSIRHCWGARQHRGLRLEQAWPLDEPRDMLDTTSGLLGVFGAVADNRSVVSSQTNAQVTGDGVAVSRSLGAPEAFGAIFDRHFPAIYGYLARRVGRERAEDLAAQTFVVAFERRASYQRDVQNARPWLYGIATKLLANDRRAEQRRLQTVSRLGTERASGQSNGAAVDSDWDLASALAKLEAEQRDVLFLHVWAGLSYEEIAGSLGLAVGTVSSRLTRARASLRAQLTEAAIGPASTRGREEAR